MKSVINSLLLLFGTVLFIGLVPGADAQTVYPAANYGNIIATGVNPLDLNSAYCAEYDASGIADNAFGVTWSEAGVVSFKIGDNAGVLPTAMHIPPPAGYSTVANPDIVIGAEGSPTSFLWVGVVYTATTATGNTDLFMDIYPANSSTNGGLQYTSTFGAPVTAIQLTTSGTVSATFPPHIDIITALQPSGPYMGRISDNWFVLTYIDNGDVRLLSDNFRDMYNYQISGMHEAKTANIPAVPGGSFYPDVAGIQKDNGSSVDFMALITYCDATTYNIYYQEWNISSGVLGDAVVVASGGKTPRIDAVDPYTLNAASGGVHYSITYTNAAAGGIMLYNDAISTPQPIISSSLYPFVYACAPSVAFGPGNTFTTLYDAGNGHFDIYAQQINKVSGSLVDYNFNTVNYNGAYTNIAPSVAQQTNRADVPTDIFVCGYDMTSNTIWYKTSGNPLNFKGVVSSTSAAATHQWSVAPNPAYNRLILKNGDVHADNYMITDAMGKIVAASPVASSADTYINVSDLEPSIYYLQVMDKGTRVQHISFTKQ